MRLLEYKRTFLARFIYDNRVIAWECSVCNKLFSLTLDEMQQQKHSAEIPSHIRSDFKVHSCGISVYVPAEKLQLL